MPRPRLSPAEIAAFRGRIAQVASELFAAHGYEAVTMRAVADALGVTAMALYRYVEDKEGLLALVRTVAFRAFADSQERALATSKDPGQRLRELGKAYVTFALEHAAWYRMMFELDQPQGPNVELEHEVKRSFSYLLEAVQGAVATGVMQGDPVTLAHLTWARVHGVVSLHLAGKLNLGRDIHALVKQMDAHVSRSPVRAQVAAKKPRRKPKR